MIYLISEGLVRRVSSGIHGPESNQKHVKYNVFVKVGSSKSVENISCLTTPGAQKLSKKFKIQRFLYFPDKGRVCQKSFERNLGSQKVVKNVCKLPWFREDRDIKVCEKRKLLDDRRSPKVVKKVIKYIVFVKATN